MAVHACTITLAESLKSLSRFMCVCVCVYSRAGLVAKSCPILATPWTVAHQAPLTLGFPKREYWSGLPFPPPGDLPDPGIKLFSPALADGFFTIVSQGQENPKSEGQFSKKC